MTINIELSKGKYARADFDDNAIFAIEESLNANARIGVACSGGADSVFLLYAMAHIAGAQKKNLRVLHFNHKARGNADIDEDFVRGLAEKLKLDFVSGSPENKPQKISEDIFRKMRMKFFQDTAKELHLDCIAQGHHANDVAETLIMRLMRGAGLEGMCAPRPVSALRALKFVRPLLKIKKEKIISFLESAKIDWREDESNAENDFLRNKIRNGLVREIQKISDCDFADAAARTRELLEEDARALDKVFTAEIKAENPALFEDGAETLAEAKAFGALKLGCAATAQAAMVRRALMALLAKNNLEMRASGADSFVKKATAGESFKASAGDKFVRFNPANKTISIEAKPAFKEFDVPLSIGKNVLPDGNVIRMRKIALSDAKRESIKRGENDDSVSAYLDLSAVGTLENGALMARNRREGDAYAPLGRKTPKKIKKLLEAKKTPHAKRKGAVLVYNKKGEILWSPILPPANAYKLGNSGAAIELTFEPL